MEDDDIASMLVKELREELKSLGCPYYGLKAELQVRLRIARAELSQPAAAASTSPPPPSSPPSASAPSTLVSTPKKSLSSPSSEFFPSRADIEEEVDQLSYNELRKIMKSMNLPAGGKKEELRSRLVAIRIESAKVEFNRQQRVVSSAKRRKSTPMPSISTPVHTSTTHPISFAQPLEENVLPSLIPVGVEEPSITSSLPLLSTTDEAPALEEFVHEEPTLFSSHDSEPDSSITTMFIAAATEGIVPPLVAFPKLNSILSKPVDSPIVERKRHERMVKSRERRSVQSTLKMKKMRFQEEEEEGGVSLQQQLSDAVVVQEHVSTVNQIGVVVDSSSTQSLLDHNEVVAESNSAREGCSQEHHAEIVSSETNVVAASKEEVPTEVTETLDSVLTHVVDIASQSQVEGAQETTTSANQEQVFVGEAEDDSFSHEHNHDVHTVVDAVLHRVEVEVENSIQFDTALEVTETLTSVLNQVEEEENAADVDLGNENEENDIVEASAQQHIEGHQNSSKSSQMEDVERESSQREEIERESSQMDEVKSKSSDEVESESSERDKVESESSLMDEVKSKSSDEIKSESSQMDEAKSESSVEDDKMEEAMDSQIHIEKHEESSHASLVIEDDTAREMRREDESNNEPIKSEDEGTENEDAREEEDQVTNATIQSEGQLTESEGRGEEEEVANQILESKGQWTESEDDEVHTVSSQSDREVPNQANLSDGQPSESEEDTASESSRSISDSHIEQPASFVHRENTYTHEDLCLSSAASSVSDELPSEESTASSVSDELPSEESTVVANSIKESIPSPEVVMSTGESSVLQEVVHQVEEDVNPRISIENVSENAAKTDAEVGIENLFETIKKSVDKTVAEVGIVFETTKKSVDKIDAEVGSENVLGTVPAPEPSAFDKLFAAFDSLTSCGISQAEYDLFAAILLRVSLPICQSRADRIIQAKFAFLTRVMTPSSSSVDVESVIQDILHSTRKGITQQEFDELNSTLLRMTNMPTLPSTTTKTPSRQVPATPSSHSRFTPMTTPASQGTFTRFGSAVKRPHSTFLFTSNKPSPIPHVLHSSFKPMTANRFSAFQKQSSAPVPPSTTQVSKKVRFLRLLKEDEEEENHMMPVTPHVVISSPTFVFAKGKVVGSSHVVLGEEKARSFHFD